MSKKTLNLEDTTALAHKSTARLALDLGLFAIMRQPLATKLGPALMQFALRAGLPVKGLIRSTLFETFCGGVSAEETAQLVDRLGARSVSTVLDFALEGSDNPATHERVHAETIRNIAFAAKNRHIAACALKFSGLCPATILQKVGADIALSATEQKLWRLACERLDELCETARRAEVVLMVDAEESWLQKAVDDVLEEMMARCNTDAPWIYTTAQMYRHGRLAYLHGLWEKARARKFYVGIKLVRGAYLEKERERAVNDGRPSPLYAEKGATDEAYDSALALCVQSIECTAVCVATHNKDSIIHMTGLMQSAGLAVDDRRISFSQLLGMGDPITYNLAQAGYHTSKYVPYGPLADLLPYLARRIEENSAVRGQSSAEFSLIYRELQRRLSGALGSAKR